MYSQDLNISLCEGTKNNCDSLSSGEWTGRCLAWILLVRSCGLLDIIYNVSDDYALVNANRAGMFLTPEMLENDFIKRVGLLEIASLKGGTFHLRLKYDWNSIAQKYREGNVEAPLKRELKRPWKETCGTLELKDPSWNTDQGDSLYHEYKSVMDECAGWPSSNRHFMSSRRWRVVRMRPERWWTMRGDGEAKRNLWWKPEAVLTCKSVASPPYRGERLIEPSSSWFPPKFPSG